MSVIARVSVPGDGFLLDQATRSVREIEFERILTSGHTAYHYFWVQTPDRHAFESSMSGGSFDGIRVLDSISDRRLYRGVGNSSGDPLTNALLNFDVELLYGRYSDTCWQFRLGFADLNEFSEFQNHCVEELNVKMELDEVFTPAELTPFRTALSEPQREALIAAHEEGYFDVPRGTSQVELADRLGLSDQAVSERLRRGTSKLVQTHLLDDERPNRYERERFR